MNIKVFNGFKLKIIMVILMVFDHIAQFIPDTPYWFHWSGRIVAPIFFFLLTEGYKHTRSKVNYMKRLFIWAGIMFIGNAILSIIFKREFFITNNIFFSMALGISLLIVLENDRNIFLIGIILFFSAFAEGSLMSTAIILIFHYLKENNRKMSLAYLMICAIFLQGGFTYDNLFILNPQWMMIFALPFILMYNGERGKGAKYFFYVFYPIHIWILYIIGYIIEK